MYKDSPGILGFDMDIKVVLGGILGGNMYLDQTDKHFIFIYIYIIVVIYMK